MVLIDEKIRKIHFISKVSNFNCYWLSRRFSTKKVKIEEKRRYGGLVGNFDDCKWFFETKAQTEWTGSYNAAERYLDT